MAKNRVGYWRLGEAKGPTVFDRTKNGHHGTYHGTPTLQARGALKGDANTAVKLDGKRSYIEIPAHKDFSQPTSGKGLTVEVWLRPDVLAFEGETDDPCILARQRRANTARVGARFYSNKSKKRSNRISAYIFNTRRGPWRGRLLSGQADGR